MGDFVYVKVIENPNSKQIVVSALNGYELSETIFNTISEKDVLFKITKKAEKIQIYCAEYSGVVVKIGIIGGSNISVLLENQIQELLCRQQDIKENQDNLTKKVDKLAIKKVFTFSGPYLNLDTSEIQGLDVLFLIDENTSYNKDINIEYKPVVDSSFVSYANMNNYNPYSYIHIDEGIYRVHVDGLGEHKITIIVNPSIPLLKKLTTRPVKPNIISGKIGSSLTENVDDKYSAKTGVINYNLVYNEGFTNRRYFIIFPNEYICTINIQDSTKLKSFENYIPFSYNSTYYSGFVLTFKKKDETEITLEDLEYLNNNVKIYIHSNYNENYDIVISASDTSSRYKKLSDIILDGNNDNEILQSIIGSFSDVKVLLYPGTYNISKQYTTKYGQKGSLFTNENVYEYKGEEKRRTVQIDGYTTLAYYTYSSSVTLLTTTELYNKIKSGSDEHSIIAVPRLGENLDTQVLSKTIIVLNNLAFVSDKYDAPIRFVDMIHASKCLLNGLYVYAIKDYKGLINFDNEPNSKLIGIAVGHGSNDGIGNKVEHCVVMYCHAGVQCCGEHYIFEDVLTHHCINGFEFGTRLTRGNYEHPNIMLGCSIEGCYRLILLSNYGETEISETWSSKNTLICIGLSTELSWGGYGETGIGKGVTLPIKETIKGLYRGYISADGSTQKGGGIFEQDGSGKCMQWKSYLSWHSQSYGTQKPLAQYVMPGTIFMDTNTNKPIFSTGEKWVNSDGTDA